MNQDVFVEDELLKIIKIPKSTFQKLKRRIGLCKLGGICAYSISEYELKMKQYAENQLKSTITKRKHG